MTRVTAVGGVLVVDGANVVGSRPDGWWRDRAGAAARLGSRLACLGEPVILVLEGQARRGLPPGLLGDRVVVVHADGSGDDAIVALLAHCAGPVTVVTADRALQVRVRERGAQVCGPRELLARLPP